MNQVLEQLSNVIFLIFMHQIVIEIASVFVVVCNPPGQSIKIKYEYTLEDNVYNQ